MGTIVSNFRTVTITDQVIRNRQLNCRKANAFERTSPNQYESATAARQSCLEKMEQIPLNAILDQCFQLTRKHLVVEWVPVEDPMYRDFMRGREELYGSLSESDLLNASATRATVLRRDVLSNGRVLLLLGKLGI